MTVADIMTRSVVTCRPEDTLDVPARLMWDHDCGCIPVVDAEGRPVSMITDRDICMAAMTRGRPLHQMLVSSAASRAVYTVRETDYVGTVEHVMQRHRVRRVPVVDGSDRLVGLLSMNDLATHIVTSGARSGLSGDGVTRTLAAICHPSA